jgi:hypothetical protein
VGALFRLTTETDLMFELLDAAIEGLFREYARPGADASRVAAEMAPFLIREGLCMFFRATHGDSAAAIEAARKVIDGKSIPAMLKQVAANRSRVR